MIKKYVKGDKESVTSRINQVSDITIYAPVSDRSMDYLYDALALLCSHYISKEGDDMFIHIPAIDFYNVALFAHKYCTENDIDTKYIFAMVSIIKSFANLKYISIKFVDDANVTESYERIINIESDSNKSSVDVINELTKLYSIDAMEMYLGDMFDQEIIDLINKHLIANEIISNSYLEREFLIEFDFDEYISYINMFINNNKERLSMYDVDIMDYLRTFPAIIGDISKPNIKLYTNYSEV
jgi:predicted CopG family antitoxin